MFQKNEESKNTTLVQTIIGPAVRVEGELNAVGNVIVEGMVNGKINTDKDVTIGGEAQIKADISATNASISGTVTGNLFLSEHLTIKSTARVTGDISTNTIAIESGAQINGQIKMGREKDKIITQSKKVNPIKKT